MTSRDDENRNSVVQYQTRYETSSGGTQIVKIAFRDVLHAVFRCKWKMLVFFVTVSSAVIAWVFLSPEIYQSEASILVRQGRENMVMDPSVGVARMGGGPGFSDLVRAEKAIIESRTTAEKVVDDVGVATVLCNPDESPAPKGTASEGFRQARREIKGVDERDKKVLSRMDLSSAVSSRDSAVNSVMQNLTVVSNGSIINLTYDSRSPYLSKRLLDAVVRLYLDRHIEVHAPQASTEFVEARLAFMGEELAKTEDDLEAFRKRNQLISLQDEKSGLIDSIRDCELDLMNISLLKVSSDSQVVALQEALRGRSERVESSVTAALNPLVSFMKQQLVTMKLEEKSLQALYPDSNRTLVDLREKIAGLDADLADELAMATVELDVGYQKLQSRIDDERVLSAGFQASGQALQEEIARQRERLRVLAGHELTWSRMKRDVEARVAEYIRYKASLSQVEAYAALDLAQISNVSIIQEATIATSPIRPRKARNIALGLFLGLFGAIGFACLLDYTDDTFKNRSDLERLLDLPVLAIISEKEFQSCT